VITSANLSFLNQLLNYTVKRGEYDVEVMESFRCPGRLQFFHISSRETETDEFIVSHVLRLLIVQLPSVQVIIGVLSRVREKGKVPVLPEKTTRDERSSSRDQLGFWS
jgi:hypothetical protein